MRKIFFTVLYLLFLFHEGQGASLSSEIEQEFLQFKRTPYLLLPDPDIHLAVKFVHKLYPDLQLAPETKAVKIRLQLSAIITKGIGVGGVGDTVQATLIERKILLGTFWGVTKKVNDSQKTLLDNLLKVDEGPENLTLHEKVLFYVYQASKDESPSIVSSDFLQDTTSYVSLLGKLKESIPPTSGIIVLVEEWQGTEAQTLSEKTRKINWQETDMLALAAIYFESTGKHLVDGCAIVRGWDFPWSRFERPNNREEIFSACERRRDKGRVQKGDFLDELANEALLMYEIVTRNGDDKGDPDIRIRHFANHMGSPDEIKTLYERLGYKPTIGVSRGKKRVNL